MPRRVWFQLFLPTGFLLYEVFAEQLMSASHLSDMFIDLICFILHSELSCLVIVWSCLLRFTDLSIFHTAATVYKQQL